jgi:hypothetical protein
MMSRALVLGTAALAFSAIGASAADLVAVPYGPAARLYNHAPSFHVPPAPRKPAREVFVPHVSAARLYNHARPLDVAPAPRKPTPEVYVPPVSDAPYDAPAPAFTTPPTTPGYYIAQAALAAQPSYDYGAGYWGREGFWGRYPQ